MKRYKMTVTPRGGFPSEVVEVEAKDGIHAVAAACDELGASMMWGHEFGECDWTVEELAGPDASSAPVSS